MDSNSIICINYYITIIMIKIFLTSKFNKCKYKTYKINLCFKYNKKYKIIKFGVYNAKLNILSCLYNYILKYLKQGVILSKKFYKIILYFYKILII